MSEELLRMEPDEALERLADALTICKLYKHTYFDKKSQLSQYFKETPVVEWDFKPSLVFTRLDRLVSQLQLTEVRTISDNQISKI